MSGVIASLAITGVTTGASFYQASKQRKLQDKANADAAKAMSEARKRLDVNYAEAKSIKKEPYELEREANLVVAADAMQAAREADPRGSAATAGRIAMATGEQQAGIRSMMGNELTKIEDEVLAEESRLRDINTELDLGEVAGAQEAAAAAEQNRAANLQAGVAGVASMGQQAMQMAPLYAKTANVRNDAKMQKLFMQKNKGATSADYRNALSQAGTIGGVDFSSVGGMNDQQYGAFIGGLTPNAMKGMARSNSFNYAMPQTQQVAPGMVQTNLGNQVVGLPQNGFYNINPFQP
tara:strand:- start:1915 stop:2796 length:882 start_codon:yes stop_codon:yes gene_type:complete